MKTLKQCFTESIYLQPNTSMLCEMANIGTNVTGLPVVIWVSVKVPNHARARMKFNKNKGNVRNVSDLIPISIDDNPQILLNNPPKLGITNAEFEEIRAWIIKNKDILLKFWNSEIQQDTLILSLKK